MFCVYWVAYRAYMAQFSLYISAHSWPNTPCILFIESTVGPYRLYALPFLCNLHFLSLKKKNAFETKYNIDTR